jgi:gluconate 5-dehydrogenase
MQSELNAAYLQRTFGIGGRTALITGSGRGIGLAIARALGHAGARVVVNDVRSAASDDAVQSLRAEGIEARAACFDVADAAAVNEAQRALAADEWHVDVLVNNAGNQNRKAVLEMRPEEWQQLMDVHVNGAFHCSQAFLRGMCARGFGRIVMMSSVAGQAGMPKIAAYSTAKGALAALTRALAVEYGPHGITANAVAPGFVRTEFTAGLQQRPGFEQFLRDSVPCGRWAIPEDVAPAVLYLCSPAASFVNGQVLAIDGGMLASL